MNPSPSAQLQETVNPSPVTSLPPPRWKQIPVQHRRELIMTLVTILVKRLPTHPSHPQTEMNDD